MKSGKYIWIAALFCLVLSQERAMAATDRNQFLHMSEGCGLLGCSQENGPVLFVQGAGYGLWGNEPSTCLKANPSHEMRVSSIRDLAKKAGDLGGAAGILEVDQYQGQPGYVLINSLKCFGGDGTKDSFYYSSQGFKKTDGLIPEGRTPDHDSVYIWSASASTQDGGCDPNRGYVTNGHQSYFGYALDRETGEIKLIDSTTYAFHMCSEK